MKKNKKELIVFLGMKTTGKDYGARPYIEYGFKKIAFADPLRNMLWSILGFAPNDSLNYQEFKSCKLFTNVKKFLFIKKIEVTTVRKMLQNLGSTVKSMFGETFWAKLWYENVLNANCNIVCTDCRFNYEIKKAQSLSKKGYNVTFIWCCYENANFTEILKDKHESEALAQFMYLNAEKYGLKDCEKISTKTLNKIIKDFETVE